MAVNPNDKVFVVNENINTKYGGVDPTGEFKTVSDLKGYKVYTALLTQSGGSADLYLDTGTLTIGVTYNIENNSPGMDFTNVGAPNNNLDTSFVATGTTPASWGSNEDTENKTLLYIQGAPVVTVLENTIGNIWFTYADIGQYYALSENLFPLNKTGAFIGGSSVQSNCPSFIANSAPPGNPFAGSGVYIQCSGVEYTPDYYTDDALLNTMLEIRVYN
jgi:hypothetical protein